MQTVQIYTEENPSRPIYIEFIYTNWRNKVD